MKTNFDYKKIAEKSKNIMSKMPWAFGKYAFWVILILVLLAVAFGWLLFYNYVIAERELEKIKEEESFEFKEDIYNKILETWDKSTGKDQEIDFEEREYKNPFLKK
jgi:hypothetical protein